MQPAGGPLSPTTDSARAPEPAEVVLSLRAEIAEAPSPARHRDLAQRLASLLLRLGRPAEVLAVVATAIDPEPDAADRDALRLRAHVAAARLHLADAVGALAAALDLEERARAAADEHMQLAAISIQTDALAGQGRHDQANALVDRGIEIARLTGSERMLAQLLGAQGRSRRACRRFAEALHAHLEAMRLHREAGRAAQCALEIMNVSMVCGDIGATEDAVSYAREALALAGTTRDERLRSNALGTLSIALQKAGEHDESTDHARSLLEIAETFEGVAPRVAACERLGNVLVAAGRHADAAELFRRGMELATGLDDPALQTSLLTGWAEVCAESGDKAAAAASCDEAWKLCERASDDALRAELHRVTALMHERRGDPAEALVHVRRHHALAIAAAARAADARLAELQLAHGAERSERQLRLALESLPDGILLVRRDGSIAHANESAARLFDRSRDELREITLASLLPADVSDRADSLTEAFFADPAPRQIPRTLRARRADGSEIPVEIALGLIRTRDETLAVCSVRDVSRLRHAESELRTALAEVDGLRRRLEKENVILREELESLHGFEEIVGNSPPVRAVLRQVEQVAPTGATVLLLGETGTGKELFARAVHGRSTRQSEPLVTVNCAAMPETLIESELFGHVAGSFTGALADRAGRFEMADGGTIFLDEIGDLPLAMQAKLLRVLQDGEMQRIGSGSSRRVDVRVLAATNRNLTEMVSVGTFRADLYYRLNVFPIVLPPLRDRSNDVPLLVWFFVQQSARRMGRRIDTVPEETMARFLRYAWPGNVRELQNVVERAVILASDGVLRWEDPASAAPAPSMGDASRLEDVERAHVTAVLERCGWRVKGPGGAAEVLDMNASTLRSRMRKLGIERPAR